MNDSKRRPQRSLHGSLKSIFNRKLHGWITSTSFPFRDYHTETGSAFPYSNVWCVSFCQSDRQNYVNSGRLLLLKKKKECLIFPVSAHLRNLPSFFLCLVRQHAWLLCLYNDLPFFHFRTFTWKNDWLNVCKVWTRALCWYNISLSSGAEPKLRSTNSESRSAVLYKSI